MAKMNRRQWKDLYYYMYHTLIMCDKLTPVEWQSLHTDAGVNEYFKPWVIKFVPLVNKRDQRVIHIEFLVEQEDTTEKLFERRFTSKMHTVDVHENGEWIDNIVGYSIFSLEEGAI